MILGAWTRVAGAGLSCPDWPLCHGKLIPPLNYEIMLEYFHRLAVSLVSLSLILISGIVVKKAKYRKDYGTLLLVAWILLFIQIIFGGLTVLKLLKGEIVATHLTLGLSFFSVLLVACLRSYRLEGMDGNWPELPYSKSLKTAIWVSMGVVFLQVILGGMVSSHFAGLACPEVPTCQGLWFPGFVGNVGLHFLHRVGAVIVSGTLLYLCYLLSKLGAVSISHLVSILSLLSFQWLFAITMIYLKIPQFMSVAHLGIAILIFASLLVTNAHIKA